MKKRTWSMLLALVLVLGLLPTAALADPTTVFVGGVELADGQYLQEGSDVVSDAAPSDSNVGYAYYKDGVLKLHNYEYTGSGYSCIVRQVNIRALIYSDHALTIALEGTNKLSRAESGDVINGIYAGAALTLTGSAGAALEISADGAGIFSANKMTLSGCELTITSGTNAIHADYGLSVTDCKVDIEVTGKDHGIYCNGGYPATDRESLVITNSSVTITAGKDGIRAEYADIILTGSDVDVEAGSRGIYGFSYHAAKPDITVISGIVRVAAEEHGLYAGFEDIAVNGGSVSVTCTNTDSASDASYYAAHIENVFAVKETLTVQASTEPYGELVAYEAEARTTYDRIVIVDPNTPVSAAPVITYDPETFTVTAAADGDVSLRVDGVEVDNPYTFTQGAEAVAHVVAAEAKEPGKLPAEATLVVTIPAKELELVHGIVRPARPSAGDEELPFSDVTDDDWFYDAVADVCSKGLMTGTSADRFDPHLATSRAMLVTTLWRLEGEPAVAEAGGFADVEPGSWYAAAVDWAASKGIVEGHDGMFRPNDPITREQFAAILYRYARAKGYDVSVGEDTNILSYDDAFTISEWAYAPLQWAAGAGLLQGSDGRLMPQDTATRAQTAAILSRFTA